MVSPPLNAPQTLPIPPPRTPTPTPQPSAELTFVLLLWTPHHRVPAEYLLDRLDRGCDACGSCGLAINYYLNIRFVKIPVTYVYHAYALTLVVLLFGFQSCKSFDPNSAPSDAEL